MASLDTNGYNSAFRTFVEFAQMTHKDGYDSANAKATLNGRRLTVSAMSLHETSAVMRKSSESAANEATRQMFRLAVIDMFGGIAKVPESVKKAMELDDYGHGRPLTARRILAVKTAIDADGTAKKIALESFASADVKVEAQRRGIHRQPREERRSRGPVGRPGGENRQGHRRPAPVTIRGAAGKHSGNEFTINTKERNHGNQPEQPDKQLEPAKVYGLKV